MPPMGGSTMREHNLERLLPHAREHKFEKNLVGKLELRIAVHALTAREPTRRRVFVIFIIACLVHLRFNRRLAPIPDVSTCTLIHSAMQALQGLRASARTFGTDSDVGRSCQGREKRERQNLGDVAALDGMIRKQLAPWEVPALGWPDECSVFQPDRDSKLPSRLDQIGNEPAEFTTRRSHRSDHAKSIKQLVALYSILRPVFLVHRYYIRRQGPHWQTGWNTSQSNSAGKRFTGDWNARYASTWDWTFARAAKILSMASWVRWTARSYCWSTEIEDASTEEFAGGRGCSHGGGQEESPKRKISI
ncbi:hypothetical protein FB45DRAFT_859665 [Roridomyces roridus]|uniref:Uncharacterized protein n=1 Tax=Roridomyces roridus TaxID=1738132 RepID=A0AAD7CKD7_9AGAR|nr:hypothetical protein FB45DRAFT_859665 [Roridomyces roridus]